ncbi:MAG: C45 family autoproteolytic acyltransferase/hydrolase [Planctomycetota bacterium]|jgi:hypothetical protein
MPRASIYKRVRVPLAIMLWAVAAWLWIARWRAGRPLDKYPNTHAGGTLAYREGQLVLRLRGSPEELGEQHGALLRRSIRRMLDGYVNDLVCNHDSEYMGRLLDSVRRMRPSLPEWYREELEACARAADVDPDMLLLAQSEGCIRTVCGRKATGAACSSYAVFGRAQLSGGGMRVGRNLDYMYDAFVRNCALVMYVEPEDGHAFVGVGWTGILGGWTLVNEGGLALACHLGGGMARDPTGLPSLVLLRLLAQKAKDIDEALEILRSTPRMSGQIIFMAQPGDAGRPPRAVAVELDAKELYPREASDGVLVVTNTNLVFGLEGREPWNPLLENRYRTLHDAVLQAGDGGARPITAVANTSTVHSVEIDLAAGRFYVAHGHLPAHTGPFVEYELPRWTRTQP